MDISAIVTKERTVEVNHPATGEPLGIRVSLMAISDPRMKKLRRKIQDEKLRLEARGKHFKAEVIEENQNALIFGAMTGWEWYGESVTFKGSKPEFNKANVYAVLTDLEWFADQISAAISEEKDFF